MPKTETGHRREPAAKAVRWEQLTDKQQVRVRRIASGDSDVCYQVCADTCQMLDNVRHMKWFHEAVARELGILA